MPFSMLDIVIWVVSHSFANSSWENSSFCLNSINQVLFKRIPPLLLISKCDIIFLSKKERRNAKGNFRTNSCGNWVMSFIRHYCSFKRQRLISHYSNEGVPAIPFLDKSYRKSSLGSQASLISFYIIIITFCNDNNILS